MSQQIVIEYIVVGIAPTAQPEELEETLSTGVDHQRLAVITKSTPTQAHEESPIHFIHVHEGLPHDTTDVDHETILGDEAILTDAGGVNVPNISADTRYVSFFTHPEVIDHLAGYPMPSDVVENYNDAIDEGRSVVVYKAQPPEAPAVEQQFKDAGLKNVKTFPSKQTP